MQFSQGRIFFFVGHVTRTPRDVIGRGKRDKDPPDCPPKSASEPCLLCKLYISPVESDS